ncbi:Bladder cancer-associated protein [Fasciola gigantica]|uniref:Bladder cancer-associated protein n=1 Tax=Fasciola gigantica TaxID=46835 RepID=A0A504Z5B6_FASGI|nr:Bladder cancer-associated protein [Fasciola gigantica]
MFCLQWVLPLLFLPKPVNPAGHLHHMIYVLLFLTCFFLERKPCGVCAVILFAFLILPCSSSLDKLCLFTNCVMSDSPLT